jgi:hypothetical protein
MIDQGGKKMFNDKASVMGILTLVMFGIAYIFYHQGNDLLFVIFVLISMVFLHFAKSYRSRIDATDRIRKAIVDMGYSSNDVERLTTTTANVLSQIYAQRGSSNPKLYEQPKSAMGAAYDLQDGINSIAKARIEWTTFTDSELVAAVQTAAALNNVAPPQR